MLRAISEDFKAVIERDPAAREPLGKLEVILTYAGFHAIVAHRINHYLHKLGIPFFPRWFSQIMRFLTGIEIHPGARIAPGFFIDHGTGVVIGETTEIGRNVTLFQGVTLGGTGKQRGKRHPTLGDNVVVGAGAKILGNICIGSDVRVGAGSVVVKSVPNNCTVVGVPAEIVRQGGKRVYGISLDHGDLPDPVMQLRERIAKLQKEIDHMEEYMKRFHKGYGKERGSDEG